MEEMFVNDLKPSFQSFLSELGLGVELEIAFEPVGVEKGYRKSCRQS